MENTMKTMKQNEQNKNKATDQVEYSCHVLFIICTTNCQQSEKEIWTVGNVYMDNCIRMWKQYIDKMKMMRQ